MKAHVCDATCPPLCKHKQAGSGGIGRKKAKVSIRGRSPRETAYFLAHRTCECTGCTYCYGPLGDGKGKDLYNGCYRAATEVNHVEGRGLGGWNRDKSPLQSLCTDCHRAFHAGTSR